MKPLNVSGLYSTQLFAKRAEQIAAQHAMKNTEQVVLYLPTKLFNLNFYPVEVVSRCDPQLQEVKNTGISLIWDQILIFKLFNLAL